jgi:hypothetical protein
MIALDSRLAHNAGVVKRYGVQSIAASDEEKLLIHTLALAYGVRPATAARFLLYRGLEAFLSDGNIKSPRLDVAVMEELEALVAHDRRLSQMKSVAEQEIQTKAANKKLDDSDADKPIHPTDAEIEEDLAQFEKQLRDTPLSHGIHVGGSGKMTKAMKDTIIKDRVEKRRQELLSQREAARKK